MEEIQTILDALQDYSASLKLEILSTKDQIFNEEDKTHITFLTDHLRVLRFEFHKTNIAIYVLLRKLKEFQPS